MALHLLIHPWNRCLPAQAMAPTAEMEKLYQLRWTFEENRSPAWPPSWSCFKTIPRPPQASYISLVPNVISVPSHLWEQPGCLSLQKWKQDSEDTRREEFRRSPRVACPPSFSRVRVYFARPISLAEIRGYSQCWTVTLLLASLADTIAFYFNKFIILCVMCNYVPDWIRKKNFQKLRRNVLLFVCRSTRPRAKETCENMNISLLFRSFATVDLTLAVCSVSLILHQFLTLLWFFFFSAFFRDYFEWFC